MRVISEFLSGSSPWVYCFIFFGKLIEVALATLRQQLIVKGQRIPGAVIAMFEYAFWICITASALADFAEDPIKIIVLIFAFSLGNFLGSLLEEQMALGFCMITAVFIDKNKASEAEAKLRAQGQALTVIPAEGIAGAERIALLTTVKRKDIRAVKKLLFAADPHAVITVQSIQQIRGGTVSKLIK